MSNATASSDPFAGLIPPPTEINDDHKVYSIAAGCIVMCVAASGTAMWRLYLRLASRKFGLDDYAMTFALLCYLTWCGLAIYINLHAGVGKPLWELTLGEIQLWYQGIVACNFLYPVMSTSIRVSLLLFYRRIFVNPATNAIYVWTINIFLALQLIYMIVFCAVPVLVCPHISQASDPLTSAMYCNPWIYVNETISLYTVSLGFDLALLTLPIFPIASLRMPTKKRAGVLLLFLLGFTASMAAAWKLGIYTWELNRLYDIDQRWYNFKMSRLIPPQFDSYGVTFWIPSMLEPTLAIICASLPGLRPALARISEVLTSVFASTFGRSHHSEKIKISDSDQPSYDWATHTIGGSSQKLRGNSGNASRDGLKGSHSEVSSSVGADEEDYPLESRGVGIGTAV